MENTKQPKLEMLPNNVENPRFEQRESGRSHSTYETEKKIYACIRDGDAARLMSVMKAHNESESGLVVGRLSDNSLRQTQYLGVSCITLSIRYAIEGGLDENEAYNLSDKYIQIIDKFTNPNDVLYYMSVVSLELTELVRKSKNRMAYPLSIKMCLNYIDKNLHNKISLGDLAAVCNLSEDYLSALFKKNVGAAPSKYILRRKLEASKDLLNGKHTYSEIGYYFAFCSETYYITCFKKEFGLTPLEYQNKINTSL